MTEPGEMDDARKRYEFKKTLEKLEAQEGDGTELITLYIPPDKQIYDVTNQLKDEYGQCANIKSKQTRTNVQSAISSILSRLKYDKRPPAKGMAVFCGTVKLYGDRTDLQCTLIEPPEPLNLYMYRCSSNFELEPLKQMLEEKYVYGLLVLDRREVYWGFLRGNRIRTDRGFDLHRTRENAKGWPVGSPVRPAPGDRDQRVLHQGRRALERNLPCREEFLRALQGPFDWRPEPDQRGVRGRELPPPRGPEKDHRPL